MSADDAAGIHGAGRGRRAGPAGTEHAYRPSDMDPLPLSPGQWDQLARLLVDVTAFAGLAITAAFAILLSRVVLPTFADEDADDAIGAGIRTVRRLLYPVAAAATVGMVVALGRGLLLAVDLMRDVYPRFLI